MALTVTTSGSGTSTVSGATVAATVTASVGDMLIAFIAADNAGTNGASSISSVTDSAGNTYTQQAIINNDTGAANDGITLGVYTSILTSALAAGTVTANFSPNTPSKVIQIYRVQPGAGETVSVIAVNTTGALTVGQLTHVAPTVSVTNGDTIFGVAALESRSLFAIDTDTTNGSWSTQTNVTADSGVTATSAKHVAQWKTVNATGNQSWQCETTVNNDGALTYIIVRPTAAMNAAKNYGQILG